jgi:4-amino-4-deoxy-L-arabinose transferase-like glycosyltransferase
LRAHPSEGAKVDIRPPQEGQGQHSAENHPRRWRPLGALVGLGLVVRLIFLALTGELELWADEAHYVQLAAMWSRFGFYMGSPEYLWPPIYPAYLALCISLFGESGIAAAKIGQVLLSGVVGASVVLLAWRLFSYRAALVAGLLWAGYLPLVGYSHLLWPETLFLCLLLPAIYLFTTLLGRDHAPGQTRLRLVAVGALLGLAILTKEAALPLPVLFGLLLMGSRSRGPLTLRTLRAAVLVLSTVVVVLPWTLRHAEVYGRWVVGGATLGRNMLWGVNANYLNFDYTRTGMAATAPSRGSLRRWLIEPPPGSAWGQSEAANLLDREEENVRRGLGFARSHPGFYLRSRIKRLADWLTPLSFFDRHYRLGLYRGWLEKTGVRRTLITLSVLSTMLVLAGTLPGLLWVLPGPSRRLLLAAVFLTFLVSVLINAISRYRVPTEPLMLVLTAGFMASAGDGRRSRRWQWVAVLAVWVGLVALWLVNANEVWGELARVW